MCKPGALFRDVGKVMSVMFLSNLNSRLHYLYSEPIARSNGCAVVRTFTGHGVNNLFHCAPNIPHYAKNRAVGTMKPGMVSFWQFYVL